MNLLLPALITLMSVFVLACSNEKSTTDSRPLVVATTTMVADLAREIGGDRVNVQGLMAPGIDPHNYVPKLADTRLLEDADVVLYNGLHLEGRFQATLEAMAKRGRTVVAVTDGISPNQLLAPQEDYEGTKDPHVWGDPLLWAATIDTAVQALTKADPEGAQEFRTRGDAYRAELESLMKWAQEKITAIPEDKRILVSSHDAFFYFGRAFGFDVRGLQGVSTATEAGLKDRSTLVTYLRAQGVRTVFTETSINAKGISTVASEAGVSVSEKALYSDALDAPGITDTVDGETYDMGTYTGMIKHNVNTIVNGLK
jgi:manganese/zinc/iron transport system substrate-binding protein